MKKSIFLFAVAAAILTVSCKTEVKTEPVAKKADISEFLGQWTIDINGGGVGWLEVRQEDKYLDGALLWGGGSVVPVSSMFLANDLIVTMNSDVVRTRDENNNPVR
jgi:hypothetical protein